jgi:hypothetical protein
LNTTATEEQIIMQIHAQVLAGQVLKPINTKQGKELSKSRLKVMDIGPEAAGGDVYWLDFLGEAALTEDELTRIHRQQVVIEVRRMYASAGNVAGKVYLNAAGGAVVLGGQIVQPGLRATASKST